MKYSYPLNLRFKILASAPKIYINDSSGKTVLFTAMKALALKEEVRIFSDESRHTELYTIKADRIIDWNAEHHFTHSSSGDRLGSVQRAGRKSLWKATYLCKNAAGEVTHHIHETNPWVKVADSLLVQIPLLGMLSGYFLHPSYDLITGSPEQPGSKVFTLEKRPAIMERRFRIDLKDQNLNEEDETRLLLSLLMLTLMERGRG